MMHTSILNLAYGKIRHLNKEQHFLSPEELRALDIAIRHEIPRRPNVRVEHHNGGTEYIYHCAECFEKLEYAQACCHECGQHQDWSEEWED